MPKQKSKLTEEELLQQAIALPFESRFQLWEQLRTNIQKEALELQQAGEKASKILNTFNKQ